MNLCCRCHNALSTLTRRVNNTRQCLVVLQVQHYYKYNNHIITKNNWVEPPLQNNAILSRNYSSRLYWENTFVTASRAMKDYILDSEDLEGLAKRTFRNAHGISVPSLNEHGGTVHCYLKSDVEKRALEVWGSWHNLERELTVKRRLEEEEERRRRGLGFLIAALKKTKKEQSRKDVDTQAYGKREERVSLLRGSARVVKFALVCNATVLVFKLIAYMFTGSATMLSEAIHSLADLLNQSLLAFGISQSIRKPDISHPYGFSRARYVYSLISGVGIFFLGAGVTMYHGVMGLIHPHVLEFLPAAFAVLLGSVMVEGASLIQATKQVQYSAKESGLSFKEYILRGRDPTAVAVLLEDSAAVGGVFIAGTFLGLSYVTGNPMYDALGSMTIGGLLGIVALFLIQRNSSALVGRSIPAVRLKQITDLLESDVIVRSVHDVKATDLGADTVRFKAEINFDGREVTRLYLANLDLEKFLQDFQKFSTVGDVEKFLLEHGEHVVDRLGVEVDRIEMIIKKDHPEIRHVDLEIL